MITLPTKFSALMSPFFSAFATKKIYARAMFLLLGCILTQGNRTVCGVLRTLGLQNERKWDRYHNVLSRAKWSAYKCSKILLYILIRTFVKDKTIVVGLDDTVERRWGAKISKRGIYRDAVRSSKGHFVKCSGLRWLCAMLLVHIPWTNCVWALPFLSVLAPSKRYHSKQGKEHKKITDWARQISLQLHKWLADYQVIMIGDCSFSVIKLFIDTCGYVTWITRMRIDAALYDLPIYSGKGRPPSKGTRQPNMKYYINASDTDWQTVCFSEWYGKKNKVMRITSGTALRYKAGQGVVLIRWVLVVDPEDELEQTPIQCTDISMDPIDIVKHFVKRWRG